MSEPEGRTGRGLRSERRRRRPGQAVRLPKRTPRDLSEPLEALAFPVEEEAGGERIDRFLLARLPWRSRSSIVELLAEGRVRRNGEVLTKKAARVQTGDRVEVEVPPPEEPVRHAELAESLEGAFLYEDAHLAALAKPAGLVVHPVGRIRVNTLIQALHWRYRRGARREERGPGGEPPIPRICHRLDRDTSGVLVVAKTARARSALGITFEGHRVEKEYLAVVAGRVQGDAGRIDLPLGPDPEAEVELMMTTREDGAPSLTTYRVLERFESATLVRFQIHTGRQHQIRVHARALGHPVLLDPLYGDGATAWPSAEAPLIARQALHAARLAFAHPVGGERLELTAPLPADLQALVERLRGHFPPTVVL